MFIFQYQAVWRNHVFKFFFSLCSLSICMMEHGNYEQSDDEFPELDLKSSSKDLLHENSASLIRMDSLKLEHNTILSRSRFSGDVLEVGESAICTDSDTISSIIECSEAKPRRYSSPFTPVSKRICNDSVSPVFPMLSIFTYSPGQCKSHWDLIIPVITHLLWFLKPSHPYLMNVEFTFRPLVLTCSWICCTQCYRRFGCHWGMTIQFAIDSCVIMNRVVPLCLVNMKMSLSQSNE